MREGLTVGRSLPAAAIVRFGWGVVNGVSAHPVTLILTLRQISVAFRSWQAAATVIQRRC